MTPVMWMPYTLLEFGGNRQQPGEAPPREKWEFAAFRPKNNFVGWASGQQKRPSVAFLSLGIHAPQVSRPLRGSEPFAKDNVFEGTWPEVPEQAAMNQHCEGTSPFEGELRSVPDGAPHQ